VRWRFRAKSFLRSGHEEGSAIAERAVGAAGPSLGDGWRVQRSGEWSFVLSDFRKLRLRDANLPANPDRTEAATA